MDENFHVPLIGEKRNALVISDTDTSRLRDALRIFQGNSFILNDSSIAVRYTLDNMQVLRNMGYKPADTPSPILAKYAWPGMYKPMRHQKVMAEFLTMHKRCYNFSDMGVGKTAAAIWASHFLLLNKKIKRVLILCPLSVMKDAWLNDLSRLLMGTHVEAALGSRNKKLEAIQSKAQYVILNYDSVTSLKKELQKGGFDLIICDEATYLKNDSTQRTKAVRTLVQPSTWVWMLTGTPIAQSPMDAYGMARICRPETVPKSMTQFKAEVMDKVTAFKWVPKPEAVTVVHNILQPAIRYKKEDCLDLPEKTFTYMEVEMTKEQNHYYEKMRKEQYLNLASGEVTAVNAGVLMSKLLQISCIAKDTPVLTQSGWKAIQYVVNEDKVWDGENWVNQDGALCKGVKQVENCFGVHMTLDHKVLTTEGWQTARSILYGKPSKKFVRTEVRLPDSYRTSGYNSRHSNTMRFMVVSMRLWRTSYKTKSIFENKTQNASEKLRMSSWERNTQNGESPSVFQLSQYDFQMSQPKRQRLLQLWKAGYICMQQVARIVSKFLGRYGAYALQRINIRQNRQQWALCEGELPLGYSAGTMQQHTSQCRDNYSERRNDSSTSRQRVWSKIHHIKEKIGEKLAYRNSIKPNVKKRTETYDLINCGPRNRFVVMGDEGPLIVHNCGAVYDSTGEHVAFDSTSRLDAMVEIIRNSSHKTLVFATFKHSVPVIVNRLQQENITYSTIGGATSGNNRAKIIQEFQNHPHPEVLVIQPRAASHGITLHAANTVIWYSPCLSTETYLQANDRVHRKGQKNPCTIVHIIGSSAERKVYRSLQANVDTQDGLLSLYKEVLEDDI